VSDKLRALTFSQEEKKDLLACIAELKASWGIEREQECERLKLQIHQLTERLNRTTDAYLEGALDREAFEERKGALITERRALTDRRADYEADRASIPDELQKFVELAGTAYSLYSGAITTKKRRLLRTVMSNCSVDQKKIDITWQTPFLHVAEREEITGSTLVRETHRTSALPKTRIMALLIDQLCADLMRHPNEIDFSVLSM